MSTVAPETSFQLDITIRNSETNEPIVFKQDGERFTTNTSHMHIAGSDLPLHTLNPKSGEAQTEWNTTGIEPTKQATRQELPLTLQGPNGTLKKVIQSKFYNRDDSHADLGHKLEILGWRCHIDAHGNILVVDEQIK